MPEAAISKDRQAEGRKDKVRPAGERLAMRDTTMRKGIDENGAKRGLGSSTRRPYRDHVPMALLGR